MRVPMLLMRRPPRPQPWWGAKDVVFLHGPCLAPDTIALPFSSGSACSLPISVLPLLPGLAECPWLLWFDHLGALYGPAHALMLSPPLSPLRTNGRQMPFTSQPSQHPCFAGTLSAPQLLDCHLTQQNAQAKALILCQPQSWQVQFQSLVTCAYFTGGCEDLHRGGLQILQENWKSLLSLQSPIAHAHYSLWRKGGGGK